MERKLISDGGIPKQEKQIYVKQALEQMNPELKEIIIMFYFQDFKLKEIADILQIGLPLVKYRHKRAKEELKRLLERRILMNLEKMMETYKRENSVTPREEKILETIQKSKEIVMEVQSENTMSYTEFLFSQFRLIRKRWWMLQAMLLVLVFLIMPSLKDTTYFMRMLGVASVFFIVMIIPEFWRNKESNSCQIEVTCLFSLRQIYSARIFLIGIVDIVMLTIFLTVACINMKMQFTDLLVQFLFPMVIAAGICFAMLNCSLLNEATSIVGCFLWGGYMVEDYDE